MDLWMYFRSIMTSKCIAAVLFAFRPGRNGDRLTLDLCSGWVRHVGYFPASGTYAFEFGARLSKGAAEVALLDRDRRQLIRLDLQRPTAKIDLDAKNRYSLRWDLKSATGKCALRWRLCEADRSRIQDR